MTDRSSGTVCQGSRDSGPPCRAPCSGRSTASTCQPKGAARAAKSRPSSLQPHRPWTNHNTLSASSTKEALEAAAKAFDEITDVLGLMYNRKKDEVPAEVTELVEKRAAAKKAKDWATADAIRAQLTELGWAVKDTAQGPQLSKL